MRDLGTRPAPAYESINSLQSILLPQKINIISGCIERSTVGEIAKAFWSKLNFIDFKTRDYNHVLNDYGFFNPYNQYMAIFG